jgi:hypothetical protein
MVLKCTWPGLKHAGSVTSLGSILSSVDAMHKPRILSKVAAEARQFEGNALNRLVKGATLSIRDL